jgi:hypothetical protein
MPPLRAMTSTAPAQHSSLRSARQCGGRIGQIEQSSKATSTVGARRGSRSQSGNISGYAWITSRLGQENDGDLARIDTTTTLVSAAMSTRQDCSGSVVFRWLVGTRYHDPAEPEQNSRP